VIYRLGRLAVLATVFFAINIQCSEAETVRTVLMHGPHLLPDSAFVDLSVIQFSLRQTTVAAITQCKITLCIYHIIVRHNNWPGKGERT